MPIQIKELSIKTTVENESNGNEFSMNNISESDLNRLKEEVLNDCLAYIEQNIAKLKER